MINKAIKRIMTNFLFQKNLEYKMEFFFITYDKGKYEYGIIRNGNTFGYYKFKIGKYNRPMESIEFQYHKKSLRILQLTENEFPRMKEFLTRLSEYGIDLASSQNLGNLLGKKWDEIYVDSLNQIDYQNGNFVLNKLGIVYGKKDEIFGDFLINHPYRYQQVLFDYPEECQLIYNGKDGRDRLIEFCEKHYYYEIENKSVPKFPDIKQYPIIDSGYILLTEKNTIVSRRYIMEKKNTVIPLKKKDIDTIDSDTIYRINEVLYGKDKKLFGLFLESYSRSSQNWIIQES